MSAPDDILSALGLDPLIADPKFVREGSTGNLSSPFGTRAVLAGPGLVRSLFLILERERAGSWPGVLKIGGQAWGRKFAADLDARLAAMGKPMLTGLPLEACLVFIENHFAVHGLGRLKFDLAHASEHGVVVAHLEHSFFGAVLPENGLSADPMLAGLLQGFFDHVSGQSLDCAEIACVRRGAGRCTFVVTDPERLAAVAPSIGSETAEAIIARLCT